MSGNQTTECPGCGYDLAAAEGGICPECGTDPSDASLGRVVARLGPAAWLAGAWAVLPALGGIALLYYIKPISAWLVEHQSAGYAVYIGAFILTAGFGFLPTYAQAILAGFAFGWMGLPAALAGFVGASAVGRLIAMPIAGERVEREIGRNRKALAVREALVGRGFWPTLGIVTLVRVPPNSPFALTNFVLATSGVRWLPYLLGTAFGMLPRTAAAVYIGMQAEDFVGGVPKPKWMIFGGIALAIVVLGVIGVIANNAIKRVTGQHRDA